MPSPVHHALVWYARRSLRRIPTPDAAALAEQTRDGRGDERWAPPAKLRSTVTAWPEDPGCPVYDVVPPDVRVPGRVVYLHGGSYLSDLTPEHWRYVDRLARAAGVRVVVPRYPLAPESSWRDTWPVLRRLLATLDEPVVLAGDSAGGGLALATALDLTEVDLRGLFLMAPWVDLVMASTPDDVTDDPWLDPASLRQAAELWAGGDDPARPELSPTNGDLRGLPPVLMQSGTRDVLFPQSRVLADRLRDQDVEVQHTVETGLLHVYPLLPIPEARRARAEAAAFVRERLSRSRLSR